MWMRQGGANGTFCQLHRCDLPLIPDGNVEIALQGQRRPVGKSPSWLAAQMQPSAAQTVRPGLNAVPTRAKQELQRTMMLFA